MLSHTKRGFPDYEPPPLSGIYPPILLETCGGGDLIDNECSRVNGGFS